MVILPALIAVLRDAPERSRGTLDEVPQGIRGLPHHGKSIAPLVDTLFPEAIHEPRAQELILVYERLSLAGGVCHLH